MEMRTNRSHGLTTEEALRQLSKEIEDQLFECECQSRGVQSLKYLLVESYHHSSIVSTFRWPSVVLLTATTIVYYLAYIYGHFTSNIPLLIEATILVLILILNTILTYWDSKSRHMEIHRKGKQLSQQIKSCYNNYDLIEYWKTLRYYPHLNTPQSPCISLQWTFRDGKRVNLPNPLLVTGDIILLNPGRAAPAKCRSLETSHHSNDINNINHINSAYSSQSNSDYCLNSGDLFVPSADYASDSFTIPRLRRAAKPVKFVLLETPFVVHLRTAISKESTRKLATAFEKELHLIFVKYVEQILIPIIWVLVILVSAIHYGYLESIGNDSITWPASLTLLLLRPAMAILPLLPLTLPICWLMLNVYGLSHLFQICASNFDKQDITNIQGSPGSILTGSNIGRARDEYFKSSNSKDFYIEELDSDRSNVPLIKSRLSCVNMISKMKDLLSNNDANLWRTANLLHVLGSITALCCVDKKGILSWPNPTVDKVFFLTSQKSKKSNKNLNNDSDSNTDDSDSYEKHLHETKEKRSHKSSLYPYSKAEFIQLDITHDPHNAYGLQFDDTEWQKYLSNLKPLGLAILLNTCNQEAQEEFVQFCDHVACESLHNEAAVPVVNKRCLCELARQIGFTENAVKGYEYNNQIAMFRHVMPEVIQKGKLAKSLNFPRLKMPFPNMTCAVIKDIYSSTFQLFSQGTGDLVLDACTEYWDGSDLCLLTDSDRKKILDFYHRSSLTSYCSAFSYVPLNSIQEIVSLNDSYIELPPDSSHLFPSQKGLDSSLRFSEHHHNHLQVVTDSSTNTAIQSHHLSSDSLVKPDVFDSNRSKIPKSCASVVSADNHQMEYLMHQMSNEVFIGMTTMQYQACSDFVHLVEQLETACIRFVHFSKENELRSRVFSEKMGLESGWNCHISLLNEDNHSESNYGTTSSFPHYSNPSKGSKCSLIHESQTITINTVCRSQSAPGSVNLEISTVKFADDCDVESSDDTDSNRDNESQQELNLNREGVALNSDQSSESRRMSKATSNLSPSPSRITTSTGTENSAPIAFDMSNRAKLPKGIENIRPHLENVDNVPLLVSLFTDCVPEATKEMIEIMQEYGEVVCVVGSSANMLNMPIFLQADASIGVEPMYPQVCITEPIKEADGFIESLPDNFIGPTDLARQLITLSCSLSIYRQNSIIFYQLIMEARHYMMKMRNSFQFLLSSCLSLSLAQLLASLLFLPPLLSPGVVLWLTCVFLPILSSSLMATQADNEVMSVATGKKLHLNKETILYFFICYLIKFAPSVFISVLCFALIIGHSCQNTNIGLATAGPCWMFSDVKANGDIKTDILWSSHLLIGQTVASLFLVLFLVIISVGFVHRNHLIWQRSPLSNQWWILISISLLISHAVVCIIEISLYVPTAETVTQFISSIPIYVWCIGFFWPLLLISINTITKKHEIKVSARQQRRARLEFGTKLGMNSPF